MTPNLTAYRDSKVRHHGMIVLVRVADGYDTFDEDAELLAKVLNLPLIRHNTGVPMVMFSEKDLEFNLRKLLIAGHRVAIAERVDEGAPRAGTAVKRVVATGSLFDGVADD